MKHRFFFIIFLSVIIGIVLATFIPSALILAVVFALLSIFLLRHKTVSVFALFLSLSILITNLTYTEYTKTYKNISLTGTVTSISQSEASFSVVLKGCDYKEIKNTDVFVYFPKDHIDIPLKEGNVLIVYGNATPTENQQYNPGETTENPLDDSIGYFFHAKDYTLIDNKTSINYLFRTFRDNIRKTLFLSVDDGGSASVLYAMVTGDKSYIKTDVINIFTLCGTSHLLAVSGLHVSILLSLFIFFLEKIRLRNGLSLLLVAVLVFLYSAFTGFSPSVIRASIMACTLQLSKLSGAKYDPLNSLSFAGTLILLSDPSIFYDVAFQLSFSACFGIIWIMKYSPKTESKIFNTIINALLVPVGATVFTLPLQLYYFGTGSTISVLANLMLVWIASFSLMLTFIFLTPSLLFPQTAIILKLPGYIMEGIISVSQVLSKAPQITFKPLNLFLVSAFFIALVFFTRFVHVNFKRTVAGVLLLIMPFLYIGNSVYNENTVKVNVPVLSGDSLIVHIEDGKDYIIGIYEEDLDRQVKYISRNIGSDGVLILTEKDHVSALPNAIKLGLTFDELYVAPHIAMNISAKKHGGKHIDILKTKNGQFNLSCAEFFCNGKSVSISKSQIDWDKTITKDYIDTFGYTTITIRSN